MPDLIETSLAGPRALQAAIGFLARLPEVEASISRSAGEAQRVLDEVLERVRPIEAGLGELRDAADSLEGRLVATEARVTGLEATASELTLVATRLDGAVELRAAAEALATRMTDEKKYGRPGPRKAWLRRPGEKQAPIGYGSLKPRRGSGATASPLPPDPLTLSLASESHGNGSPTLPTRDREE